MLPLLELYFRTRIPGYLGLLSVHAILSGGSSFFGVPFEVLLQVLVFAALNPWGVALNVVSLVAVGVGLIVALWHREFDLAVWAGALLALASPSTGFGPSGTSMVTFGLPYLWRCLRWPACAYPAPSSLRHVLARSSSPS